jgi:hypothetical protein
LASVAELASTRRILHSGQIAETMSRSSAISPAQPVSLGGRVEPPVWFTWVKQPLALVHAGSPYWLR